MDLSGLIFVVLAVAWAGYLIPRALRHHEEIAANRPVDSFSDTVRVLERTPATMRALLTPPAAKQPERAEKRRRPRPESVPSRSSGPGAARRRRRVLGLLLLATAGTAGAAGLAYLPWVSVAVPGALVVGWLVLCRLMVRKAPVTRRVSPRADRPSPAVAETAVVEVSDVSVTPAAPVAEPVPAAVSDPVSDFGDDGSLWDPLPLTLPTYVTKPAARRTVRTIDLTRTDVTSSGHQAEASELARSAESAEGETAGAAALGSDQAHERRAAGA